MNEIVNPADSLVNTSTADESIADTELSSVDAPALQQEEQATNLLDFTKKIQIANTANVDYNAVLDYIVKNYKRWTKNSNGAYTLKRNAHTITFDGKNIPIIDDKYFISDVLIIDKLPKNVIKWIGGLK